MKILKIKNKNNLKKIIIKIIKIIYRIIQKIKL